MRRNVTRAMLFAICVLPFAALAEESAPAGLLAGPNMEELPPITLSVGEPLGGPWALKSGKYYEVEITADGSGEIALDLSALSRAVWIDEAVVNGIEIRPHGIASLEFDEAGTLELGFVAVKPGRFSLGVPESENKLEVVIE